MNFFITHSLPIFLILISLLLALFGENSIKHFMYNRDAINDGELWRFMTAHFVHLGWNHLLMNISALIIIWFLVREFLSIYFWWIIALVSTIGISVFFYIFMVELQWYVGLSGLLHSLLASGVIIGIKKRRKESMLFLLLIFIKIIYEQFYGATDVKIINGMVVVNAHLYGVLIGISCALSLIILKKH